MRRVALSAIVALCGWVGFAVYGTVSANHALDTHVSTLRAQNDALKQQISERETEISQAQSSAWLEEQARKLGYVKPGERVYVIATPGSAVPGPGGVSAPLPSYSPVPGKNVSASTPAATAAASPTPYIFAAAAPQH